MFYKHDFMQGILGVFCLTTLSACAAMAPPSQSEDVVQLQRQIQKTTETLDEMRDRISVLQFMVDTHEKSIRALECPIRQELPEKSKAAVTPPRPSRQTDTTAISEPAAPSADTLPPENPLSLYDRALNTYNAGDYVKAKNFFERFVQQYPGHDLADNAYYWIGECLYSQGKYLGAIDQFKKLISNYPNGGKVPAALLKTGYAYCNLRDFDNARAYLKKVIVNYPFSPASDKAEMMLKKIN